MRTLAERIKTERIRQGMNQVELGQAVGVSKSSVNQWESGLTKKLVGDNLLKTAKALKVSPDWLSTGKGDKHGLDKGDYIDSYAVRGELPNQNPKYVLGELELWDGSTPLRDDEVALPYFREVELAAGSGRHEVIENHGMKLRFAKSTLKNQEVLECNAACATVSGNSMEPKLHNGTAIGIDKGTTNIVDGEMYAIDHDGSLRVKYLYKMPGGALRLRSENREEWPDETLSYEEAKGVKVIGWVFWWSTLPKRRYG
ncbi:MAG: helix-turn-helix transcriptional regulator [Methylobacter sp.]|nr:helix-turn-helix transcriptional regulator [Methylobacter sp.]